MDPGAICATGGIRIDVGLDDDPADGSLSGNEIDDSEFICNAPAVECDTAADCDDANECTTDGCRLGVCTHVADVGASCGSSTDDACTQPDTCDVNGACLANDELAGTSCDSGNGCGPISSCDGAGTCTATACALLQNFDFSSGLTSWTAANNPTNGSDTVSTFTVVSERAQNVGSSGPSARVLTQSFTVPATVSSATFSMDFAQNNSSALTPATVQTIVKGGSNGNAFRADLVASGGDIFTTPILFELFAPTAATGTVGGAMTPISADGSALTTFLSSHTGETLVLRFAHVESTFPWTAEFDNVQLSIAQ